MSSKVIIESGLKVALNVGSSKLPKEILKNSEALLSSFAGKAHVLPDLSYDYDALEPVISAETMTLHHSKHHNTYVTNLNTLIEKIDSAMIAGDVSATVALQGALKFNGGGHINHSLFWENLSPDSAYDENSALAVAIKARFGGLESMKSALGASTVAVQGSGWGWLGYNPSTGSLEIATLPNQDPLEASTGLKPLLGIDVWEHAYYVDYKNLRPDYVNAIWDIIDWKAVEDRFRAARK